MNFVRDDFTITTTDLRESLGVSPPTMIDVYKKHNTQFVPQPEGQVSRVKRLPPAEVRKILEHRGVRYGDGKRARILSWLICKGGVGKTTSALFTSQRLSAYGAKTLVIDTDPQSNLTSAFALSKYGCEIKKSTPVLVDVLSETVKITDAIIPLTPHLHLIPSTLMNHKLDSKIRDDYKNPTTALSQFLDPILKDYHFIIIDCPPALSLSNSSVIAASDWVCLPVNPDEFSQLGLLQTLQEIDKLERDFAKQGLRVQKKILFTRFDSREMTSLHYLSEVAQAHKDILFSTIIKSCADLKNVVTKQEDLFSLRKSVGRSDYDLLAREILGIKSKKQD